MNIYNINLNNKIKKENELLYKDIHDKLYDFIITDIAWSFEDGYLAYIGDSNKIFVLQYNDNTQQIKKYLELKGHSNEVISIKFNNKNNLFSYSKDNTLKVWDIHNNKVINNLKIKDSITKYYLNNNSILYTETVNKNILKRIEYNRNNITNMIDIITVNQEIIDVLFMKDKTYLQLSNTILIYNSSFELIEQIKPHINVIKKIILNYSNNCIITFGDDNIVNVINCDCNLISNNITDILSDINDISVTQSLEYKLVLSNITTKKIIFYNNFLAKVGQYTLDFTVDKLLFNPVRSVLVMVGSERKNGILKIIKIN